jgi:hypothetical protein
VVAQAEASLRQALRIYEDRHAVALAGRTRADLARLAVLTARESGSNKTSTTLQPSSLRLVSKARVIAPRQTREAARGDLSG